MKGRCRGDAGSALIGTVAGVSVFLVFMLFAVQLLVGLYGRSVLTSVAYDGARIVAGHRINHADPAALEQAEQDATDHMREMLGGIGRTASFDWSRTDSETIVLHVEADNPRFLFGGFAGPLATDHIDRTVIVRVEEER